MKKHKKEMLRNRESFEKLKLLFDQYRDDDYALHAKTNISDTRFLIGYVEDLINEIERLESINESLCEELRGEDY